MAVPKKRTGKSAQAKRRANWKASVPATTICKQCGNIVLTHTVCPACGTYKGKVVSIKAQNIVADVKEEKPVKAEETEEKNETEPQEKPKRQRKTKKTDSEE